MNIVEYPLINNRKYKLNQAMTVKGIVLHSVGCACDNPYRFAESENNASSNACVHAIIGADGTVVHTLGWNRKGWHSGEPEGNNNYIGIEMVEPSFIKYTGGATWTGDLAKTKEFCLKTYAVAVELFAYLCKMFKLDPLGKNVILSHGEITKLGWGSNHVDPHHIWDKIGLSMNQFRNDVKKAMGEAPEDVVNCLYINLLGREADEPGLKTWSSVGNFEEVFKGISESAEGRKAFAKKCYSIMLKRYASDKEASEWAKKPNAEIYKGIKGSVEYKKLHGIK